MEERRLVRIALGAAIIGCVLLYLLTVYSEPASLQRSSMADVEEETPVQLQGRINEVRSLNESMFLTLQQQKAVRVLVTDPVAVREGQRVKVVGSVYEHDGQRGVQAETIHLLRMQEGK